MRGPGKTGSNGDTNVAFPYPRWGNEVTIRGSANFKERALRLAVERGMNVNNSELHNRQREFVAERERPHSLEREQSRGRERVPAKEHDRGFGMER
ncbi:MAG: hypothetical protein GIW94_10920 [Candidatus Eremiobacteraeota bacterium]|nr:hypothetical protein [Candidatus Eremiobacteraeota bacterium]MBC5820812.1 hypothetical protein [Candidatus Eremiobacteraeota bacterium]